MTAERAGVATPYFGRDNHGLVVWGDPQSRWPAARRIWNQHSYHVTNVNDDGSIPAHEANSWETRNSYRQNSVLPGCFGGRPDRASRTCGSPPAGRTTA